MEKALDRKQATWNKKNVLFPLLLVLISTCFFYYVNSTVESFYNWPDLKYKTGDSHTYLAVGKWLLGKISFLEAESSVAIRPFFYPLILILLESISPWALIGFQFFLWLTQILLVYYSALLISQRHIPSFILATLCMSILTPIGMALHALTETFCSFLLTGYLATVLLYLKNKKDTCLFWGIIALSLASVIKPSFLYLFFFHSVLVVFLCKKNKVLLLFVVISIFPIFIQVRIMNKYFDLNKISIISTVAINDYYLTYLELKKRGLLEDRNSKYSPNAAWMRSLRRDYFLNMIKKEGYAAAIRKVRNELKLNAKLYPFAAISVFIDLIIENSNQYSYYLGKKSNNVIFVIISLWQSRFLLLINIFSFLIALFFSVRDGAFQKENFFVLNMYIFISFIYISSGVSAGQGDRFLVPIYFFSIIWLFFQLNVFLEKKDAGKRFNKNIC